MDKFLVTIYSLGGSLMERKDFTSKAEADRYAASQFARGDVGSVHVTKQESQVQHGNGRWR